MVVVVVARSWPNHCIFKDFIVLIVKKIRLVFTVKTTLVGIVTEKNHTVEMIRSIELNRSILSLNLFDITCSCIT